MHFLSKNRNYEELHLHTCMHGYEKQIEINKN